VSRPEFARRAGGSFFAFLVAAILVPLGLGGVTLRLRTGRVVLLVLAAVLVVLFLLGAVNAALNAPG
jgi:4-amino-4-deoxy-L-arabinose transferase-like glycosyltransferase